MSTFVTACVLAVAAGGAQPVADDAALREEAAKGLRRAVEFFTTKVGRQGGYLYRYDADDLTKGQGEGKLSPTQVEAQPPGTPTVGLALVRLYRQTGDRVYLDAAVETARCLVRGQLRSGGWAHTFELDRDRRRKKHDYRVDRATDTPKRVVSSTLDDNTTQACLLCLARVDEALEFKDAAIHEAAEFGLRRLLEVQYPAGGWPQRFEDGRCDPAQWPVVRAGYPDDWPRTFPNVDYKTFYTLNDGAHSDAVALLFAAADIYKNDGYRQAACRGLDFLLLAQMPDPQPAWAQQYNARMHPAWARKFEPASVTGGESQEAMTTLLLGYARTGEKKYLEPIPRAIDYLRRSLLADGKLARFYELQTNRPLYFTRADYQVTYSDADMPRHYSFKVGSSLDAIERQYRKAVDNPWEPPAKAKKPSPPSSRLRGQVRALLAALDEQGRWAEDGVLDDYGPGDATRRVVDTTTFLRNAAALGDYLEATQTGGER